MNPWEFRGQLAENIRSARKANNLSQKQLAQQIGVTANCISLYETAKRMPNLEVMSIIANVLDVSLDDMIPVMTYDVPTDPRQTTIYDMIG